MAGPASGAHIGGCMLYRIGGAPGWIRNRNGDGCRSRLEFSCSGSASSIPPGRAGVQSGGVAGPGNRPTAPGVTHTGSCAPIPTNAVPDQSWKDSASEERQGRLFSGPLGCFGCRSECAACGRCYDDGGHTERVCCGIEKGWSTERRGGECGSWSLPGVRSGFGGFKNRVFAGAALPA